MNASAPQILIVDDEEGIRKISSRMLLRNGYEVRTAAHGKEALSILNEHSIDLIVSDLKMPLMDGTELLSWVRVNRPNIPVVIATAYGTVENAVSVLKSGASDYLLKPFDSEELLFTVKRCLEEKAAARRARGLKEILEIHKLSQWKSGQQNEKEVLGHILHQAATLFSADGLWIFVFNKGPETKVEWIGSTDTGAPQSVRPFPLPEAVFRPVVAQGVPKLLSKNEPEAEALRQAGISSFMAVPLHQKEGIMGVLAAVRDHSKLLFFDREDLVLFDLFAANASLVIASFRAFEEQEELNLLKSEFVSNVSHELRTPLSAMGGALELLNQDFSGKLEGIQAQLFRVVVNDFERLSHVIRNVLDYSRLERGKFKMMLQRVPLDQVITRSLHEISPLIDAKPGLTISTEFPGDPLAVMADREQIFQVFMNLLSNAVKFTPEPGRITLGLKDQGQEVLCTVRDSGIGIGPEHHEKVFERFYQVDGSATRSVGGTGIGLAIVQAIVDGHGGRIWVESEKGKGSAFHFLLPKEPKPAGEGTP